MAHVTKGFIPFRGGWNPAKHGDHTAVPAEVIGADHTSLPQPPTHRPGLCWWRRFRARLSRGHRRLVRVGGRTTAYRWHNPRLQALSPGRSSSSTRGRPCPTTAPSNVPLQPLNAPPATGTFPRRCGWARGQWLRVLARPPQKTGGLAHALLALDLGGLHCRVQARHHLLELTNRPRTVAIRRLQVRLDPVPVSALAAPAVAANAQRVSDGAAGARGGGR